MLFILSGLYELPLQLYNKVFKFDSIKNQCGEGIKEFFQVFSEFFTQKITDMLSSNHHSSLYTKLITVLNKEDWQSMK